MNLPPNGEREVQLKENTSLINSAGLGMFCDSPYGETYDSGKIQYSFSLYPVVNVTWPLNKPTLVVGQSYAIRWNSANISALKIFLGKYSDPSFRIEITPNASVTQGFYAWTVPAKIQPGNDYRIHLQQVISPTQFGVWDQEPISIIQQ